MITLKNISNNVSSTAVSLKDTIMQHKTMIFMLLAMVAYMFFMQAHAGSDGNNYAKIRALKLNPVQIRIGEVFARRPDTVNLPYIQKSSEYVPEEAFTYKGSIVIRKIHEEN